MFSITGFCVLVSLMGMVSAMPNEVATGHLREHLVHRRSNGRDQTPIPGKNYNKNDNVDLTCDGKLIQIQTANYEKPGKNGCTDPSAKTKVAAECNGKETCSFKVATLFDSSSCTSAQAKMKLQYECVTNPCSCYYCANKGQCKLADPTNDDFNPECECVLSWKGDHCDENPCDEVSCQNGGTCAVKEDGSSSCYCLPGHSGQDCGTIECSDDLCGNGGTCTLNDATGSAQCCCTPGYTGSTCSERVCDTLSCANGVCVLSEDGESEPTCKCNVGYAGEACENKECSDDLCGNGGTCTLNDATGSAQCCCTPGYTGSTCSERVCDTIACGNGVCVLAEDGTSIPTCQCNVGYTGDDCETKKCSDDLCGNGGTCTLNDATGSAQCCCTPGYTGSTCSERVCDTIACVNGVCVLAEDGTSIPTCQCNVGYTGPACATKIPYNPCDNGGTYNDGKCTCSLGFGGDLCTIPCTTSTSCPAEFQDIGVTGSCYFIPNAEDQKVNWHVAKTTCEKKGANLWEPDDVAEKTTITNHLGTPDLDMMKHFRSSNKTDDNICFVLHRKSYNDEFIQNQVVTHSITGKPNCRGNPNSRFVNKLAERDFLTRYWTAANDINAEGTVVMVKSGTIFTGPFRNGNKHDCVQLHYRTIPGWEYEYRDCSKEILYICEKKKDPCLN